MTTVTIGLLTERGAVLEAIQEYDELGADAFRAKYGYGPAKSYQLIHNGRSYDSKAIVGVAVGKQHADRGPMTSHDFTGGTQVKRKLESLGFQVVNERGGGSLLTVEQAQAIIVERIGEPKAATAKLVAWITPGGCELALQRESSNVSLWLEQAPPNDLEIISVDYPGNRTRHSGLKSNVPRLAQPFVSYLSSVETPEQLTELLDWYTALSSSDLDLHQLQVLKEAFLREMPEFQTFETPGKRYQLNERSYKDEFAATMRETLLPLVDNAGSNDESAAQLSSAFISLFTKPLPSFANKPQNLINWRTIDRLKPKTPEEAISLGRGVARLLDPSVAIDDRLADFARTLGLQARDAGPTAAADDARSVGSCILMLLEPDKAIIVRWQLFDRALSLLRRQRMSEHGDDHVAKFKMGVGLAENVFRHMRDVWNWAPRDLIDVQSFLWVALEYRDASEEFAPLFEKFVDRFAEVRERPYQKDDMLWELAERVTSRLSGFQALKSRPDIKVSWSAGKGVWAAVPWISLLDTRVTTTTQEGVYVVFLLSNDLARVYLTLNQGVTRLVGGMGQAAGAAALIEQSKTYRAQVPELQNVGFELDGNIDLGSEGKLSRNYELGTIASRRFDVDSIPDDDEMNAVLDALLSAYERIAGEATMTTTDVGATYTIEDALTDVFMDRADFENILEIWRAKKNIILQGAPGVGKSFIARRLAYVLMGEKVPERVEALQFHQSYGYEDFIQGYRPTETGGFELKNGSFYRFCRRAIEDPENDYVIVIDEINRGNLSKIFGELMLLIEHDKRSKDWATRLAYAAETDDPFWVPENVYIIGMMNTADRSLSLVDYALRRRFSFVTLAPAFSHPGFRQHLEMRGVPEAIVTRIVEGMNRLNEAISEDAANLGAGFRIGHSFFVPGSAFSYSPSWMHRIVQTEIYPLLEEYWFDAPQKAVEWREVLIG